MKGHHQKTDKNRAWRKKGHSGDSVEAILQKLDVTKLTFQFMV